MTGDEWKREWDAAKAELLALVKHLQQIIFSLLHSGHHPSLPQQSYLGKEDGKTEAGRPCSDSNKGLFNDI